MQFNWSEVRHQALPWLALLATLTLSIGFFLSTAVIAVFHSVVFAGLAVVILIRGRGGFFPRGSVPTSAWWLLAFVAIGVVSLLTNWGTAHDPFKSLLKLKYPLAGLAGAVIMRHLGSSLLGSPRVRPCVEFFLVCMGVASFYGLIASLLHFDLLHWRPADAMQDRAGGFTGTMRYAHGVALCLVILSAAYVNRTLPLIGVRRGLIWGPYLLGFAGLYFSYTRGAMLGFLVGLPVAAFLHHRRRSIPAILLAMIAIGFLLFGDKLWVKVTGIDPTLAGYPNRVGSISDGNSVARLLLWKAAVASIREHPFLGLGINQFRYQSRDIAARNGILGVKHNLHAHNLFLDLAANTGLLGAGAFLCWLLAWGGELVRQGSCASQTLIPFLGTFLACGLTEYNLDAQQAMLVFFIYSISAGLNSVRPPSKDDELNAGSDPATGRQPTFTPGGG